MLPTCLCNVDENSSIFLDLFSIEDRKNVFWKGTWESKKRCQLFFSPPPHHFCLHLSGRQIIRQRIRSHRISIPDHFALGVSYKREMSLPKPGGSFPGPEESTTKTDIPDPSVGTKTDPETIALTPAFSSELLSDFELEQLVSTQNAVACGVCVGADSFITKGQKKGWLSSSSSASGSCDVNTQPARTLDDVGEFGMTADEVLLINSEQIARASTGPDDISTPIATSRTINNSRSSQSNLGLLIHKEKLDQEVKRLKCLREYMILDSKPEPRFERITALASRIFNVEIALISLVDIGRQWFMSNRGLGETKATPRKDAFCHYTVGAEGDLFIVEDALQDIRFKDNPLVTGSPYIR